MAIKLIHGDAKDYNIKADLILTDPPFEMGGQELASIISQYEADHLILICSLHQLLDFSKHTDFRLNWDTVIDLVAPKQSKSDLQPNYIHAHAVYMTRNRAKSRFSRKRGQRTDAFKKGYFPTIIRANRERNNEHGHAKNQQAIQDLLSYFSFSSIVDMFAGSGTTGLACSEINEMANKNLSFAIDRHHINDITLIEKDADNFNQMKQTFKFLGEITE